MAVEDLNLTGPGDEATTNGGVQDNTQNTDTEISLPPGDGMSTNAFADYSSTMTFKPIYGASNPDIFQGPSISHISFNLAEKGLGTDYSDLAIMHEFLKNNTDARNSLYNEQANEEDIKNFTLDYRQTDGTDRSVSGFGNNFVSGVNRLSDLTGIPRQEFLRSEAVYPAIQKNVNSQYTISTNSRDYNMAFVPFTDYAEMTISNNNMSDLLTYNLGENITDGLDFNIKSVDLSEIYNKTPEEFEQDIIRNSFGIKFNDRKDLVSNFANASNQEKVEIYQQLFSLETKLSDRVISGDDPILFQYQKDYKAAADEFQSLVSSGVISIDIPEPPVATEGTFVEAESMEADPSSGLVDANLQQAMADMSSQFQEPTFEEKYKAEFEQAKRAYISKIMREKYGEDWSRNYEIEQAAVDGLNKIKEIMERTNLSYKDVIRQLNGDILPSLDPDQYGIPGATGLVYDFDKLRTQSPSRDKLAPNTPEAIISEIRGQFIKNKAIKKSIGYGGFQSTDVRFTTRKYTDEEAYALAVNLAEGKGMSAYLGEFDEDGDGAISEKEAGILMNSLLEEQAAEYNWLSGQMELHQQLAIASIVMNDNRDMISEGDLQDVEIAGITYKATPRQVQLYQHHMRMANDYGMRFSTFTPSDIKDVYGELAYIKAEDQIALDKWAAENPLAAFFSVTSEAITSGIFSGGRGMSGLVNSTFAEFAYLFGADDVGDKFYEAADGLLGDEMTVPTIAQMTGIRLTKEIDGYRFMTDKEGNILGPALDENFSKVDPRLSNEVLASMSDEEIKELGLTSSYERSLYGFYSNGLKIGTQILSTMNSGAVAGLYSTGLSQAGRATLMNSAKMGTIFLTSYDAQYDMLSKSGISPREASLAAAANSVFTTLTAQAFGVEFFGKASPLFNKVLGRYSDDLVKAVAQADSKAVSQVNAEILKTVMAGAGLEFTQETLDQIQKNITKELLLGGSVIDGIPGMNEMIDIGILSATFGGAGAAATINISDFTTTQQEYFIELTKDPAKLQSRLDKAVRDGELTQEQANRAMVLAKEYIENTSTSLAGVADNIRHQIVVEQIKINKDLEAANQIKDDATRQKTINEINERQKRLDDRIDNAVKMDRLQIYSFKGDEIPAHLLNHTMRFNDKTGKMEVFATRREVELGYNSNVNVIVKDGKVSSVIESNAASISSDPETNMVTIKVTDQYKGAKVSIYNELGQLVKFENADIETGEVAFDGSSVRDGGYSVKVEGQLDVVPGIDIEAEGKTQSQIQSDLDAAVVEDAVIKIEENGVPITKLTNEEYDSIPAKDGVNPKDTKAMVVDGVIVLRQDQPPSSRELFEEVAHWVLTNPDFETEGQFVDFNTVVEALNSDPAAAGIIGTADLEALTRLYPKGQVSNEALAGVLADLAVGHKELNLSARGKLYSFLTGIRDMVSPSKTTVNEDGEMNTTPSRISLYNSQDVTNTLVRLSDVMSRGGVIEATALAAKLPATDVDTTPEVQAAMKDSKRLQDQVDAGEISIDNQVVADLFQEAMGSDLSAFPELEAARERFAKETLADPENLSVYLKAFQNDIDAKLYEVLSPGKIDPGKEIEVARQAASLPNLHYLAMTDVAEVLRKNGDSQGALEVYNQAIEKNPDSDFLLIMRAFVKEEMGDVEGAKADREAARATQRRVENEARKAEEQASRKAEEEASQDVQQDMPEDQQEDMPEEQQEETQTTPKDDVTPAVSKEQVIDEIISKSQRLNSEEFLDSIPNDLNKDLVIMFNRDIKLDRASLQGLRQDKLAKINEAMTQALELESFNPFFTQYIDLMSRQNAGLLTDALVNLPTLDFKLARSKVAASIRANANQILTDLGTAEKAQKIEEMINGMTASMIDLALGNYNSTDIKESLVEPWMESTGAFLLDYTSFAREVAEISAKLSPTILGLDGQLESNVRVESKYRVQAALLQLEFLLNPGNPNVSSVDQYIDIIVKPFEGTTGRRVEGYSRFDIKILKGIKRDFSKLDMSSVDAYLASLKKMMSPEEFEVFEDIRGMYDKLAMYNEYINGTILGNEVVAYEGYVHHASAARTQEESISLASDALKADAITQARMDKEPPQVLDRTSRPGAIEFDFEFVINRAAKSLMEYAHVAPSSLLVDKTVSKTGRKLSGRKSDEFNGIKLFMANFTEVVINNVSAVDRTESFLSAGNIKSFLRKNAYRGMLSNTNRFADAISNIVYALSIPEIIAPGTKAYLKIWNSDMSMSTILRNSGCTVAQRIVPNKLGQGGKGSPVETGTVVNTKEQARADMSNYLINFFRLNPGTLGFNTIGKLADYIITAPDRPFAGPLWFGTMSNEFNALTGEDIDWEAIHNNDPAYMNMFSNQIREAKRRADENVTRMITQTGSLADVRMRINNLRNSKKRKLFSGKSMTEAMFGMSTFQLNDVDNLRKSLIELTKEGIINKANATRLLVATQLRQIAYYTSRGYTIGYMLSLLARDDYEDEQDQDILPDNIFDALKVGTVQGLASLVGIYDANAMTSMFVSTGINTIQSMFYEDGEVPYREKAAFGNKILENTLLGVDASSTWEHYMLSAIAMGGPAFNFYIKPIFQLGVVMKELEALGTSDNPFTNRKRRRLERKAERLKGEIGVFPLEGEFSGNIFGFQLPFSADVKKILNETASDFDYDMANFEDLAVSMAESQYSQDYNAEINPNYRYVPVVNEETGEVEYEVEEYNGYDEKASTRFNPETGKTEQAGETWADVESEVERRYNVQLNAELARILEARHGKKLDPTAITMSGGQAVYSIQTPAYLNTYGITIAQKNSAQRQANENLGFGGGRDNELLRYDNNREKGLGYDHLIDIIGSFSYAHFVPKKTVALLSNFGGNYGDADMYYTYEELNELKYEEYNMLVGPGNATYVNSEMFFTAGQVKELYNTDIVVDANTPEGDVHSDYDEETKQQFREWINDGFSGGLPMPDALKNADDDDLLSIKQVSQLTPYGQVLSKTENEIKKKSESAAEKSEASRLFLYGDPSIHVGHSNFIQYQGDLRIAGGFQNIPYPKTNYVNRYNANIKAP